MGVVIVEGEGAVLGVNFGRPIVTNGAFAMRSSQITGTLRRTCYCCEDEEEEGEGDAVSAQSTTSLVCPGLAEPSRISPGHSAVQQQSMMGHESSIGRRTQLSLTGYPSQLQPTTFKDPQTTGDELVRSLSTSHVNKLQQAPH